MDYETVIGLEIHAQLKTESKMFCSCDNYSVSASPNLNTCSVCLGMPGTLPVANRQAIEWTYFLGLALNAEIAPAFNFERKNYFYPDLPKAYQITSSSNPPVIGGYVEIEVPSEGLKKIRINHIHLEEDAGKLVHPPGSSYSLVDLNRAGTPLMEIVTEPDIRSPLEAKIFMQDLRALLRSLGISDANMEQGNLRCDANISLRPKKRAALGTKVEIKNMNSFKMIERALNYEGERQRELLIMNKNIVQETRGWNEAKGKTTSQRSKEEANDYRYFPEPDLPPYYPKEDHEIDIASLKNLLPELPKDKRERFEREYGLAKNTAEALTSDLEVARFFEATLSKIPDTVQSSEVLRTKAKRVANWVVTELLARQPAENFYQNRLSSGYFAEMIEMIETGEISGKIAKEIFPLMLETGQSPKEILIEKGLSQISDTAVLEKIIDEIIKNNNTPINDYKLGKVQAFGYLVGQVMAKTKGQANPKLVNKILKTKLEKRK